MEDIVILEGARTPMAEYNGAFSDISAIDLAVHASVCAICQRAIAAFDRLAAIDPGRSSMPVSAVPDAPAEAPA